MLPKRFCDVMEKYKNPRLIDPQDKSLLEILVGWGLCNINNSQVKLNYKGEHQLQEYDNERRKNILYKIFNFFR